MNKTTLWAFLLVSTSLVTSAAFAEDAAPAAAAPAADPSAIKFGALIETGATINSNSPSTGVNFGHLLTDKSNQVVLNQAALTVNRDLDPKAEGFDWGFKLQGFYGSDARYTHFIGMLDHMTTDRNQFDLVEANGLAHLPVLTAGGIDVKAGAYSTPIGYEVIQSNLNPLYSHSYIFNFGIPLKHTGVVTTTHVNDMLDIWLGVDSGMQTTLGQRGTVNGHAADGLAGFGLNGLMDGKLTVLALSHFGPAAAEARLDQPNGVKQAAHEGRYIGDAVITYKATDALTFVTELDYIRDDIGWGTGHGATAGGGAQYVQYALNDVVSLVARGEIFSDSKGFFVTGFPGNNDFVAFERGTTGQTLSPTATTAQHGAIYNAVTLGATVKLPGLPERLDGTMIRPEIRYDTTTDGTKAFNYGSTGKARDDYQFTFGADLVIPVSIF